MPKKAPLYPHIPKSRMKETEQVKREYAPPELAEIAKGFYEITARTTATVYTPTGPMYTRWENLTQEKRDQTIEGLKTRIEREGLRGYLERKRPVAGDTLTEEIISELKHEGYL